LRNDGEIFDWLSDCQLLNEDSLLMNTCEMSGRKQEKFVCVLKVKLSLCFNKAPRHEGVLGEWRYSSTHSLTSALEGGEWSASRPSRFTPRERAPGAHWIGGFVGSRAVQNAVVKRKFPRCVCIIYFKVVSSAVLGMFSNIQVGILAHV
jgi:hypothetical protein